MSLPPPSDAHNPFEAPRAPIGTNPVVPGADTDAELTRRQYLSHEASVQSIGSLYYLGALGMGLAAVGSVMGLVQMQNNQGLGEGVPIALIAASAFTIVMFLAFGAVGYGLTHLQPWARWTAVVVMTLGLLNNLRQVGMTMLSEGPSLPPAIYLIGAIALAINAYVFYLLLSPKAGVVFSREYREVIARTPHIKYKTSLIVKIAVVMIVLLAGVVVATVLTRTSAG